MLERASCPAAAPGEQWCSSRSAQATMSLTAAWEDFFRLLMAVKRRALRKCRYTAVCGLIMLARQYVCDDASMQVCGRDSSTGCCLLCLQRKGEV